MIIFNELTIHISYITSHSVMQLLIIITAELQYPFNLLLISLICYLNAFLGTLSKVL